jgi:hypothetical protein
VSFEKTNKIGVPQGTKKELSRKYVKCNKKYWGIS